MSGSARHLKVLVRYASLTPAWASASSSMAPDGPMNGRLCWSSCQPGLMPTTMTRGPDHSMSPRHSPQTHVETTVPPRGQRRQLGSLGILPLVVPGTTRSAVAASTVRDVRVGLVEGVASLAVCLAGIEGPDAVARQCVLPWGQQPQVGRVDTPPVQAGGAARARVPSGGMAEVLDSHALRDRPIGSDVGNDVRERPVPPACRVLDAGHSVAARGGLLVRIATHHPVYLTYAWMVSCSAIGLSLGPLTCSLISVRRMNERPGPT